MPDGASFDAEQWARIQEALEQTLDLPTDKRAEFLDETFRDEPSLRTEVERLLVAVGSDPDFLERPVVQLGSGETDVPDAEERIGPYRLIRPLGRGGMGEVFLAARSHADFDRHVAIKVIRRGLDTDDVLARFRAERRILASLDHPNIATLLDAGATDDGRPFFVMEHVEGEPLDIYCDRNLLDLKERIRLFQRVCGAVHHAHRNLVVHRDLKPSNVLVTEQGEPKLLDFGIAKLLSAPDDDRTRADQRVLTPDYAAPEQASGGVVTTATDVFSLGVLLYQLLTGRRPFERKDRPLQERDTVQRPSDAVATLFTRELPDGSTETLTPEQVSMLRSDVPHRLQRRLAGDLDTIVLRALSAEPERRYSSALALADDLERHLQGRPVVARPDTLGYRVRSFARRNRLGVSVAAAFALVLTASTVLAVAQARRVQAESARVRAERDKALEVRSFLLETFGATGAQQEGDSLTAQALLDGRVETLQDEFGAQPETLAEMQAVLAEGYRRLGRFQRADSLATASLALRERILGPEHPDVAASLNTLGLVQFDAGRVTDAEPVMERSVALWAEHAASATSMSDRIDEYARALNDLGLVKEALAKYDEASDAYERSLELRVSAGQPPARGAAITTSNLAALHYAQGRYDEAVELGSRSVELLRAIVGPDHRRSLVAQNNLAVMRQVSGDLEGAAAEYRDVLERRVRLLGADHPDVSSSRLALGSLLMSSGRYEAAESQFRQAIDVLDTSGAGETARAATMIGWLAQAVSGQGRLDEATSLNDSALRTLRAAHPDGHPDVAAQANRNAGHQRRLGDFEGSMALHDEAVSMAERSLGPRHAQTAVYRSNRGRTLRDAGRADEAVVDLEFAREVLTERLGADHNLVFTATMVLIPALDRAGDRERADALVEETRVALAESPDSARTARLESLERPTPDP